MALICNDPARCRRDARGPEGLRRSRLGQPAVSQARLITLRRRAPIGVELAATGGEFRGSLAWEQAVNALDEAQAPAGPDAQLMVPNVPGARLLVDRAAVDAAFDRLAAALQPLVEREPCVLLGVLLGGLMPLARLASQLRGDFVLDTCRVGRYGDATRGGIPQWLAQPRAELRDRHVLLVDDIYDEGLTLEFIAHHCRQAGARRVTTVVLVRKLHSRARGRRPAGSRRPRGGRRVRLRLRHGLPRPLAAPARDLGGGRLSMRLGVIGGTGSAGLFPGGAPVPLRRLAAQPWGPASSAPSRSRLEGHEVIFLARHGAPDAPAIPPHRVNYRANLWALRELGVDHVVAINAVGGIAPAAVTGPAGDPRPDHRLHLGARAHVHR